MVMHMQDGTREHFMGLLRRDYPQLVERYEQLYAGKYVRKDYDKRVQEMVALMRQRYGIEPRRKKADAPRVMGELGPGSPSV
jgi:hypothetical protein